MSPGSYAQGGDRRLIKQRTPCVFVRLRSALSVLSGDETRVSPHPDCLSLWPKGRRLTNRALRPLVPEPKLIRSLQSHNRMADKFRLGYLGRGLPLAAVVCEGCRVTESATVVKLRITVSRIFSQPDASPSRVLSAGKGLDYTGLPLT